MLGNLSAQIHHRLKLCRIPRQAIVTACAIWAPLACQEDIKNQPQEPALPCRGEHCQDLMPLALIPQQGIQHLYLTTVADDFQSSSLQRISLEDYQATEILAGESGDPYLSSFGSQLLFFNRNLSNQNLRILSEQDASIQSGPQQRIAGLGPGDPHASAAIDQDNLLLSLHNGGQLAIWHAPSNTLSPLDLPLDFQGPQFKPSSIVKVRDKLFVAHQAYDFTAKGSEVFGNGTIFVFNIVGSSVAAQDLDPATAGIQGISIAGNFPQLVAKNSYEFYSVSLCSSITANPEACRSVVEAINTTTLTATVAWDFAAAGTSLYMNGPAILGQEDQQLLVAAESGDRKHLSSHIWLLDLAQGTLQPIYDFAAGIPGFYGLYSLRNTREYWITRKHRDKTGATIERLASDDFSRLGSMAFTGAPYGAAIGRITK